MDEFFGRGKTSKRQVFLNPYIGVSRRQQESIENVDSWANNTIKCNN